MNRPVFGSGASHASGFMVHVLLLAVAFIFLCNSASVSAAVHDWGAECPNRICTWSLEIENQEMAWCTRPPPLPEKVDVKFTESPVGARFRVEIRPHIPWGDSWLITGDLPDFSPFPANYYYPLGGAPHYPDAKADCTLIVSQWNTPYWSDESEPRRISISCDWRYFGGYTDWPVTCHGSDRITISKELPIEPQPELVALEVNQVVQDWENSVPLVEYKHTYVRGFVKTEEDEPESWLIGYLWGEDSDGNDLPGTPLMGLGMTREDPVRGRRWYGTSLNFPLPLEWAKGTVRLTLEVQAFSASEIVPVHMTCEEPEDALTLDPPRNCSTVAKFEPVEELDVKYVRIALKTGDQTYTPSRFFIRRLKRRLRDVFPVSSMGKWMPGLMEFRVDDLTAFESKQRFETEIQEDLLDKLVDIRDRDCKKETGCDRIYHGVFGGINLDRWVTRGQAYLNGSLGWSSPEPNPGGAAKYTNAHEIGHNLGLHHTRNEARLGSRKGPCGEDAGEDSLPYEYFDNLKSSNPHNAESLEATIGPRWLGDRLMYVFGLNKYLEMDDKDLSWAAIPDVVHHDDHPALMSYCGWFMEPYPTWRWIAKPNYESLIDAINERSAPSVVPPSSSADETAYDVVRGSINLEDDTGRFAPFGRDGSPVPLEPPPAGEYSLVLLDVSGNLLDEIPFQPIQFVLDRVPGEPGDPTEDAAVGVFRIPVEADLPVNEVILARGATVLATRTASANPPAVEILYPNGGETLSGDAVLLEWTGDDPDGDVLTYAIQYSTDGGATWQTLDVDLPETTIEVETANLQGTSQGLFRVEVSDGFDTAWDESDSVFTVPNNPPEIFISFPGGNPLYFDVQPVLLEAEVEDAEETSLPASNIAWSSHMDGFLGNGEHLAVPASDLSEGEHLITVTATDSEGLTDSDEAKIRVQRDIPRAMADVYVEKTGPRGTISVGTRVTYVLDVENNGPGAATDVVLTDPLPETLELSSLETTTGECSASPSGEVSCSLGNLSEGSSERVTVAALVISEGSTANTATVTAAETDPLYGNNTSTHETTAGPFVPSPEVCDGLDNDGDDLVDEDFDADGDGYAFCGADCDDGDPEVSPAAFELCNGEDDNCNGTVDEGFDLDGDGYATCSGDCNDDMANVNPDASEECDLVDNDCDGVVDEVCNFFHLDLDADGFGDPQVLLSTMGQAPEWYVSDGSDCDDRRDFVNPDREEVCDGIDDDCDGMIDEGDVCLTGGSEIPDMTGTWDVTHVATDNNCVPPDPLDDPGVIPFVQSGDYFVAGPYLGMKSGNVAFLDMSYPEETGVTFENCNGRLLEDGYTISYDCHWTYVDPDPGKNCSGTDTYVATLLDFDGDGFTPFDNDCNDEHAGINPDATEVPNNGIDEDCDGADLVDPLVDGDGDGYTPAQGDCDDYSVGVFPGAPEMPNNGIDEDCDGEDLVDATLLDGDGDGYTPEEGDCDDTNSDVYPNADDIPNNGIDENCDNADASLTNPDWYITIWDSGYSDWMISPHDHEQLSGEWAAAVLYDGIAGAEAMWLEPEWICPDWTSNSQFQVITPFQTWEDTANPVDGYDTGVGVISNGQVEITIEGLMSDGRTTAGLSPAVADLNRILTHRYVMLQTYRIRNVTSEVLNNVALFQMMHAQPNDDYGPDNFGVYDPTPYADPDDGFPAYHHDMTFFGSDADWSDARDDIVGFSSAVPPDAWGVGEFPSDGCRGGEPGATSLHHAVEANVLPFGSVVGPVEVAGAMRWDLGDLQPGQEVQHTVLFFTGHSPAGLEPSPGTILLEPELAANDVGTSHTLTATVTIDGEPAEGVDLILEVISGPHASLTEQAVSDSAGIAVFSYEGVASGTDLIQVSGDIDGDGDVEVSNVATKEWIPQVVDECPEDPNKTEPGVCGCGVPDTDFDTDGTPDCIDACVEDPDKTEPGICGCGVSDTDTDADGLADCNDDCPNDPEKTVPGECGCGVADVDTDMDGTPDCIDECPEDPDKTGPGVCGCGVPDTDGDGDGSPHCVDCDDGDGAIRPGADELCNDVDDNCDGVIDEGCECGPDTNPCDLDADCDVDRDDLMIVLSHRNQPASVDPECDMDGDGMITVLDARRCVLHCTCARCVCNDPI